MRTIIFRGKGIDGKFHCGNLSIIEKKFNHIEPGYYISNSAGSPFAYHVIPETVGQFNGLQDRNGKDIFEGDIDKDGGIIIWLKENAAFFVHYPEIEVMELIDSEYWFEIVGNIHDSK